jgi:hypothetical protein
MAKKPTGKPPAKAAKPAKNSPAKTTRKVKAAVAKSEPGTVKAKAGERSLKCGATKRDHRGTPKRKGTVKPKHGGRIGNPPFKPTDEQRLIVNSMVAGGARQAIVAAYLGISEDTLTRHFRNELDMGHEMVVAMVGSSFTQKALAGLIDYQKFFLARRGGAAWKAASTVEMSGPGGTPIQHQVGARHDLSKFTKEELRLWEAMMLKAQPDAPRPND